MASERSSNSAVLCSSYSAKPLALRYLAEIIVGAYGPTRIVRLPNGMEIEARAAPSAGGLYPLELYMLSRGIDALTDGLYHYAILEHALEPLRLGPEPPKICPRFFSASPLSRRPTP